MAHMDTVRFWAQILRSQCARARPLANPDRQSRAQLPQKRGRRGHSARPGACDLPGGRVVVFVMVAAKQQVRLPSYFHVTGNETRRASLVQNAVNGMSALVWKTKRRRCSTTGSVLERDTLACRTQGSGASLSVPAENAASASHLFREPVNLLITLRELVRGGPAAAPPRRPCWQRSRVPPALILALRLLRVYDGRRVWGPPSGCEPLSTDTRLHAARRDADLIRDGGSREPVDVCLSSSGS